MIEPIDPPSIAALRRDREAPAPADARARVASRLGVLGPVPAPPPRGGSGANAVAGGTHAGRLLLLAFVGGGAVGALLHAGLAPAPATRVVYVERPPSASPSATLPAALQASVTVSTAGAPLPAASPPGAPRLTAPAPGAPRLTAPAPGAPFSAATPTMAVSAAGSALLAASISAAASPPRPGVAQLDAERALLDAARIALVGGDSDTALGALDRHARTYGHPMLGEERDALFIQALVRAGRYDEARTRAAAFRRKVPQSLFRPAVDDAIASIP